MSPSVCIGIVTRDRAAILPRAIGSALDQDYAAKVVRVLDDASADATPDLAADFPTVRWERSERRLGIPVARNRLMMACDADLFVGLDDDAWFLDRGAISVGVAAMAADPRIGALAFDVISPGREVKRERGAPRPWHTFQGCAHMLRMSAVREAGMYAPGPGWYGSEEKDLCLRLLDAGHEVVLLPGAHVWHDKSDMARDAEGQHASGVCNDLVFVCRRAPAVALPWLLPAKVMGHLVFSLRRRLLRPCLSGLWRIALEFPGLVVSRAPVRWETWRRYGRRARSGPRPLSPGGVRETGRSAS
ncbi:MAG TPA: glycosyltransferase [Verrucomicrobiae bacterium]|nr:glycosyltransferase [Verrucomicrobiae bacterium]